MKKARIVLRRKMTGQSRTALAAIGIDPAFIRTVTTDARQVVREQSTFGRDVVLAQIPSENSSAPQPRNNPFELIKA